MIVAAVAAVVAVVGGVLVLGGGDDEGRITTENTESEDTEPDDTEPDKTEPDETEPEDTTEVSPPTTEVPATAPPLTLPITVAPRPTTTTATVEPSPIGTSVTLVGSEQSIEATVLAVADPAPTFDFLPPEPGIRAVAVQVRAVNTGTVEYLDTAEDTVLIDNTGAIVEPSFFTVALSGTFPLTRLLPGDARVGWIVFEVGESVPIPSFQWNLDGSSAQQPVVWSLTSPPVTPSPTPAILPGGVAFNAPVTLVGSTGQVDVAVVSVADGAAQIEGEVPLLPGTRLLAIEVALFNSGTTVFTESPDSFVSLVDGNGQWYSSSFLGTASGPAFDEELALQPGEQAIAYITFELPNGEVPLKLQAALDFGSALQSAELALG